VITIKLDLLRRAAAFFVAAASITLAVPFAWASTGEEGVVTVRLANGIDARVFPSDYLASEVVATSNRGILRLDGGEYLTLIMDIGDPAITNKGDGRFHPFDKDLVVECLDQIEYPRMNVEVDVYLLPYPRADMLSSSASGSRVFLSPQVLEISHEGAAYIVSHELGHVFQYGHFSERLETRWDAYRRIRGIEDAAAFSNDGAHAYRPREIFAEDFRVLFGGPSAYFGGRVENPAIASPETVAGLDEFILALTTKDTDSPVIVSFNNYPNPFNPQTELRVELGPDFTAMDKPVTLRIYDVTGALVRELFAGRPVGPELRVTWNGRDEQGRQVASSTYFGVVEAGSARMTTKLLMLK
jgi:hypothetical protein